MIALEPQFEVGNDAPDHGEFSLCRVGEVDLHMIFDDFRVDPREDLLLSVEEHHILVYNEKAISGCQSHAGTYYYPRVVHRPVVRVELLQARHWLALEIVHPDLLDIVLELADDYLGSAFDVVLLPS